MKRYIKSSDTTVITDDIWVAIPEKYHPYIEDIQIVPQYSIYRKQEVTTYNVIFKPDTYVDRNPIVGLFHMEDIPTVVKSVEEHLEPRLPKIRKRIMDRWHPKRNKSW